MNDSGSRERENQKREVAAPPIGPVLTESAAFPDHKVQIHAEIASCITFATHQCDFPVIADLVIANPGAEDLEALTLSLAAEPPVLAERVWTIDRIGAGTELRLKDRRVNIAGGLLDKLTERMRAEVQLELRQGDRTLAEAAHPLMALARNEWGGGRFMPDLIAAFVMPNDPAVQPLLKEAAGILEASGRRASLEGYQSCTRERPWEIASAIWAAVSQRGLTYAEPPASFGLKGQKIRTPSMIAQQGLATCLDLALLFAAALEQAGLYPVVVFTEGHALAGVWLQPQSLATLTVDDPMELRKAIDLKELVLFETTLAAAGHAMPFARALAEGRRQVSEAEEARFHYAIDIRQARGRDIQPLSGIGAAPAAAGDPAAPMPAPPLDLPPALPPVDSDGAEEPAPQTPAERMERWKRSLLDLSRRNRLLNLRSSGTVIPIFCPDAAVLEDRIAQGKRLSLITPPPRPGGAEGTDPALRHLRTGEDADRRFAEEALERGEIVANLDAKALEKGAIELYRKARADFEEGGANTLFLALGMLRWQAAAGAAVSRAPLILLPVRLERASAGARPKLLRHDDDPIFNLTLAQMLRQDFALELGDLTEDLPRDETGVDVARVWETVRTRVRETPGFEVTEDVALATFSFAKYLMWKDLTDRTDQLKTAPFVRHVIDTPREAYGGGARFLEPRRIDREIDPAALMAPLNADSSQIVAINAAGEAGDFVLEGPPGTGKSETIGNIIAHNLGLGRRVLFVSEKMAALDVVHERLRKAGLGDFCLELHSAKANKRAVIDQLDAAWRSRQVCSETEWQAKADRLLGLRARLNGLVEALHAPGPAGISPRAAIGRSLRYGDVHRLVLDWPADPTGAGRAPTPAALEVLEELALRLGQTFGRLEPADLAAFRDLAHADWSFAWAGEMVAAARALGEAIAELVRRRRAFAAHLALRDAGDDAGESAAIAAIAALVPDCARLNLRFALAPDGRETLATLREIATVFAAYRRARADLPAGWPDARFAEAPVSGWIEEAAQAARKTWPFSTFARGRLRRSIREHLGLAKAEAPTPERDLAGLDACASLRRDLDSRVRDLAEGTPWKGLDTDPALLAEAIASGARLREAATRLASFGRDLAETRAFLARTLCDGRDLLEPGMPVAAAATELAAAHAAYAARLERFRALSGVAGHEAGTEADLDALARTAQAILDRETRLNVWCAWVEVRRDADAAGLGALTTALQDGAVAPDQAVDCLRTAYARWLAPILIDARPVLNKFAAVEHEELIARFRALDADLARITADYIRARLSGGVPARDGGGAPAGFGVLARQIRRQRGHMPVRQLVAEMGEALTTLTPCLMMSPLSVAQFLPPDARPFDLVVFDEASQITVPDAIGAIARGARCIVVGDPKQMPPTRFFDREAGEDENEEAQDLESILDEALAARMPHHRLTGHYRSRHESLICFSNHAYYDSELVTYPAASTRTTAVSFHKIEGVYAKGKARTNPIEARAVVAEILARLLDPARADLSIGVVTFNSEQQRLILDLLDEARRSDPELEPFFGEDAAEPVFVKNLETVQGDQRDVIMISVGYGPTEPGARTMSMNFGPLNKKGGERRLNVAITRATTEVLVFASFDAGMIDLTRSSARAVQDLKHYIDFAARGPAALGAAVHGASAADYDSDFEMAVAEGLRQRGWSLQTQIGVSKFRVDLGVVHPDAPGRYLAGVECDGATYHASPSARDRDRVRHIILENLGWRLLRLWSTDFFIDPEGALDRLHGRLEALLAEDRAQGTKEAEAADAPGATEAKGAPRASDRGDAVEIEEGSSPVDAKEEDEPAPAAVWSVRSESPAVVRIARGSDGAADPIAVATPRPDPARFYDPGYRGDLRQICAALVDAEGPVTLRRLGVRVARLHGFQRTGREIVAATRSAIEGHRPMSETPEGPVLWPDGAAPAGIVAFRGLRLDGEVRDWRDIPHPEKLGLLREVSAAAPEDLPRAVAEAIGYARVSSGFREEIVDLSRTLQEAAVQ